MEETENNQINKTEGPELVFGLVGALGSDLELVTDTLCDSLSIVDYSCRKIRISQLLHEIDGWEFPETLEEGRINKHMDKGNELRNSLERGDALALLAIGAIREERESTTGDSNKPCSRTAYVLRSLKNPGEVITLRKIYGDNFILVAAYSPRETRIQNLARRIADSHHDFQAAEHRPTAESLVKRDEAEKDNKFGQNVRESFPMADVFVNTCDPVLLRASINRFTELFFGNTFYTPSCDEYGMFHAQAAALRSASLGRQVGAVIATHDGNIIAVGTNEVPKAGGGLYWCHDTPDHRDFRMGYDTNDKMKRDLLADILKRLQAGDWLSQDKKEKNIEELMEEALHGNSSPLMRGAQFMSIIEFGRSVHAEMAALMDAARRGVAVEDCILYTSTFPCHDCAKHIVASGIQKVVVLNLTQRALCRTFI